MISVVVPTRNNSPDLEDCLKSLELQKVKPGEIIVVFDSRHDKNVALAKQYGAKTFFDSNGTIGGAYHKGAKSAIGDIIAFTDDDCIVPSDWISKIEKEFDEDIDVVCGEDIIPKNATFFQKAAYQIDKSRMMKIPVYGETAKNRLRAANIGYRKRVFDSENFNTKLKGLQEPEFHHRLYKKGFKMKFDPALYVYHKRRSSISNIFSQIYRNGKAKIDLIMLHKEMISAIDILPFAYVLFSLAMIYASLTFSSWLYVYLWLCLTLSYFILKPFAIIAKTGEVKYYVHLFFIIITREVAYSLGIINGLRKIFKR